MKSIFTKHKRIMGDTITPISTFLNLRNTFAGAVLFESSDYSKKENSKSFICADPMISLVSRDGDTQVRIEKEVRTYEGTSASETFAELQEEIQFHTIECQEMNGFFGLVGYDAIPNFEAIEFKTNTRFSDLPELLFSVYRYIVVFDNFSNRIDLLMNAFNEDFSAFEQFETTIFQSKIYRSSFSTIGMVKSNESDDSFEEKVVKSKEFVRNGDVFQLVISRAFSQTYKGDEFEVYRQLRALNPSPYMFFMDIGKARLFGASPEAQFRVNNGLAEIHPIAGTVKRAGNDKIAAEGLLKDEKENAEHTMLVDLARNDLNRACSNVTVERYKEIQSFSHVIHMVSKVTGELNGDDSVVAFGKSFPAGTLSGAPKYRAMELIDELENDNRGYYGGAIGQVAPNGNLNMAIIIRSCLAYQGKLHYQAGAGVVLDSVPKNEVQEVFNKVKAVEKAILLANKN